MEIEPASLAQVQRGQDGRMVEVSDDVANVAQDLRALNPAFRLRYSEAGQHFVVYQVVHLPNGSTDEHLVTTAQECDPRLVRRVEEIMAPGYDLAVELDKADREAERRHEHEQAEALGPAAERMAHAMRRDLGVQKRIFVPGD